MIPEFHPFGHGLNDRSREEPTGGRKAIACPMCDNHRRVPCGCPRAYRERVRVAAYERPVVIAADEPALCVGVAVCRLCGRVFRSSWRRGEMGVTWEDLGYDWRGGGADEACAAIRLREGRIVKA